MPRRTPIPRTLYVYIVWGSGSDLVIPSAIPDSGAGRGNACTYMRMVHWIIWQCASTKHTIPWYSNVPWYRLGGVAGIWPPLFVEPFGGMGAVRNDTMAQRHVSWHRPMATHTWRNYMCTIVCSVWATYGLYHQSHLIGVSWWCYLANMREACAALI